MGKLDTGRDRGHRIERNLQIKSVEIRHAHTHRNDLLSWVSRARLSRDSPRGGSISCTGLERPRGARWGAESKREHLPPVEGLPQRCPYLDSGRGAGAASSTPSLSTTGSLRAEELRLAKRTGPVPVLRR